MCSDEKSLQMMKGESFFMLNFAPANKAIVGLRASDARESGVSPELYLQL